MMNVFCPRQFEKMRHEACVEMGQQDSLEEFGPMILASGGFGADFGADSLLATYRPDLLHLPTTNGEHCTGQGLTEIDPRNHEVSG